MALEEEFKEYAEKAKSLPPGAKDADKLVLYGLYKQSTIGAVNTNRPGIFGPAERAKWDAWKAVEGKTKEEAMAEYIAKEIYGWTASDLPNLPLFVNFATKRELLIRDHSESVTVLDYLMPPAPLPARL